MHVVLHSVHPQTFFPAQHLRAASPQCCLRGSGNPGAERCRSEDTWWGSVVVPAAPEPGGFNGR